MGGERFREAERVVIEIDREKILTPLQVRRYLTSMKTTVSSKGQIILPAGIRELDDIRPGQKFIIERIDRGEYRLTRKEPAPNEGLVNWLLSCPVKDFFIPIESESTDTISPPLPRRRSRPRKPG